MQVADFAQFVSYKIIFYLIDKKVSCQIVYITYRYRKFGIANIKVNKIISIFS